MEEAHSLDIEGLNSFVNGLSRDMEAVKNAIALENNNGLAEGTVNKIKVSKRIMYGRCSFDTLKKKILLREDRRKRNKLRKEPINVQKILYKNVQLIIIT